MTHYKPQSPFFLTQRFILTNAGLWEGWSLSQPSQGEMRGYTLDRLTVQYSPVEFLQTTWSLPKKRMLSCYIWLTLTFTPTTTVLRLITAPPCSLTPHSALRLSRLINYKRVSVPDYLVQTWVWGGGCPAGFKTHPIWAVEDLVEDVVDSLVGF